jgi:GNAT superfamily N-acetyltransferase
MGFYSLAEEGPRLRLVDLWVLPEAMGKGVGRRLFDHALDRAKLRGFDALDIESDPDAEGFYLRMGAHRIGTKATEVERQKRELPLLICKTRAASGR